MDVFFMEDDFPFQRENLKKTVQKQHGADALDTSLWSVNRLTEHFHTFGCFQK